MHAQTQTLTYSTSTITLRYTRNRLLCCALTAVLASTVSFLFISSGGIVLNPSFYGTFGHTDTMVHEIGHSLGLYHVFRGISEIESCNDACLETESSLETGDLCADTNPTPKYKGCHDPEPGNETCGSRHFTHTPFNNYMSYAGETLLTYANRYRYTCKNWWREFAVEKFVESMCILRKVWNLAGTFHGKITAAGASFHVTLFVLQLNIYSHL